MITITLPAWLSVILIGCYAVFWAGVAIMIIVMCISSALWTYELQIKSFIRKPLNGGE